MLHFLKSCVTLPNELCYHCYYVTIVTMLPWLLCYHCYYVTLRYKGSVLSWCAVLTGHVPAKRPLYRYTSDSAFVFKTNVYELLRCQKDAKNVEAFIIIF